MSKPVYKFNIRDLLIAALTVGLIFTASVLFTTVQAQKITNENNAAAWLRSSYQSEKLKGCVEAHAQACDITTGAPSLTR
jgi:hypothetical protein